MNNAKLLSLDQFTMDTRLQMRSGLDKKLIAEYAELMADWSPHNALVNPPLKHVKVIYDGSVYWLIDGWHRILASKENGFTHYPAIIELGTFNEALWRCTGVNGEHGKPRTNEEKRRAVETALRHPKGQGMTDGAIAAVCRVSQVFVRKVREDLGIEQEDVLIGRNGKKYKKPTPLENNIGKRTTKVHNSASKPAPEPIVTPITPIPPNDMIYVNRHHCYHALDCECHKDCLSSFGEIVSADNTDLDDMFA